MLKKILITALAALALAAPAAATPTAPLPPRTNYTVDAGPGDQYDTHAAGWFVAYTDSSGGEVRVRLKNLAIAANPEVPGQPAGFMYLLPSLSDSWLAWTVGAPDGSWFQILAWNRSTSAPGPGFGIQASSPAVGGDTVAYEERGLPGTDRAEIVVRDLLTGASTRLTNDSVYDTQPDVDPTGSIVVWRKCAGNGGINLCEIWKATRSPLGWVSSPVTSTPARDERLPDTDGTLVAYAANDAGETDIYVAPAAGGPERRLALADYQDNPTISNGVVSYEELNLIHNDINSDVWVWDTVADVRYHVAASTDRYESLSSISVDAARHVTVSWSVNNFAYGTGDDVYATTFNLRPPDTTPPTLVLPAPIVVDATGPGGAFVSFSVSATDNADPNPSVACTPLSASLFPVGTTTVSCTATDAAGNSASGSFSVTVKGAADQLTDLVAAVEKLNLKQGIANSLDAKLDNVRRAVEHAGVGNRDDACKLLTAFVNEVNAQAGKAISAADAAALVATALRIRAVLGC